MKTMNLLMSITAQIIQILGGCNRPKKDLQNLTMRINLLALDNVIDFMNFTCL